MEHKLPELPFAMDALEPHISKETLEYHYGKHHQAYVNNLNAGVKGTNFENSSLEEIVMGAEGGIFNNAAQVWNHSFYWNCLTPNSSKEPTGKAKELIEKKWGTYDKFKEEFSAAAAKNFGSGWTWLVGDANGVEIFDTDDADTPMKHNKTPLLTIDVWEHAYYVDYRNARPKYIESFFNLINWDFVNSNIK